jgi:hypothetical protein
MGFSEDVIEQAWNRSGGKCECKRWTHNQNYSRCSIQLVKYIRGKEAQGRREANVSIGPVMTPCPTVRFSAGVVISGLNTKIKSLLLDKIKSIQGGLEEKVMPFCSNFVQERAAKHAFYSNHGNQIHFGRHSLFKVTINLNKKECG